MRACAQAPCKKARYPQNLQWAFVSALLDETRTRKIYGVSNERSWWAR
jgi:hypothetical protein